LNKFKFIEKVDALLAPGGGVVRRSQLHRSTFNL